MKIKRIHEFELNEGFVSSLFSGIGNLFKSKKSKIESILKDIKKAREEDVNNIISIEKEIWNLPKENTPEYRFDVTNLNRQIRTYSSLKGQEIDSLVKQANKIIDNDPKLQAFFSAALAKIEAEVTERMIKGIRPYKEKTYLDKLNQEFEDLVRDATKKYSFYEDYEKKSSPIEAIDFSEKISKDTSKFMELPAREASTYLIGLDGEELSRIYNELKEVSFDLDVRYRKYIDSIKKDKKKAVEQGQSHLVPNLEQEEIRIRYEFGKPIEKIRSRITMIEKEKKSRKYATAQA
jgi:hypothetical protein